MTKNCFAFLLVFVVTVSTSCLRYKRFTYGSLSAGSNCLVVLPMNSLGDPGSNEALLGEYLTMAFEYAGLKDTMGPKQVSQLFDASSRQSPRTFAYQEALQFGKIVGASGIIYGHNSKLFLRSPLAERGDQNILLGLSVYLIDVESGAVSWTYSTTVTSNEKNYLVDLAALAKEMTQAMIVTNSDISGAEGACWQEEDLRNRLARFYGGTQSSPVPAKKVVKAISQTNHYAAKPVEFTKKSQNDYYKALLDNKRLPLQSLFRSRSTSFASYHKDLLNDLIVVLNAIPKDRSVLIEAHTDATEDFSNDFWVSAKQAEALGNFFVAKVPTLKGRIQTSSKGGKEPLVPNINKKSRQKNRRLYLKLE